MKILKKFFLLILLTFPLLLMGRSTTVPDNHTPVINSNPVISSLVGVPYTYDVEATDADGDTLIYSLTSSPTDMIINASSGVISWAPSTVGDYDVTIKVTDGDSFDTQSFTITVTMTNVMLSSPTGVEASDASYTDAVEITWDSVNGATHYQVYRANSLTETKIVISGWQTDTSYDDTSVAPWTTYWYWVKAATSSSGDNATGFSSPDTGYAIFLDPL